MDASHFQLSLTNISRFGDTDIFPFPLENRIFSDNPEVVVELLVQLDRSLDDRLRESPPEIITTCAPHGYTGFRWATQIDPLWNAYFLSLVLSLTPYIEARRAPVEAQTVFSYRFKPDVERGALFGRETGWKAFQEHSYHWVKEAKSGCNFVVMCDIADFYHRISHRRLEETLTELESEATGAAFTTKKIMKLLKAFTGSAVQGLPIGGPAARILAELMLVESDRFLQDQGIAFCRFVDDYHLFLKSYEDAHESLSRLTGHLMESQGLNLQKQKTRILTRSEFINIIESRFSTEAGGANDEARALFMELDLHYDPYSETPEEDYDQLKADLGEFDVIKLLSEELQKSRIHQQFSSQLLRSFNALDKRLLSDAFMKVIRKIDKLYPIFPLVMITALQNFERLDDLARKALTRKLRELIQKGSHITRVELNAAFASRVLAKDDHKDTPEIFKKLRTMFPNSLLLKSIFYHIMIHKKDMEGMRLIMETFSKRTGWEQRRAIVAGYFSGQWGETFRETYRHEFSAFQLLVGDWVRERLDTVKDWSVPL
jgi:hypothetical protein